MSRTFLGNEPAGQPKWPDMILHISMGLMPALGVLLLNWNVYTIIFLFAWETIVTGVFHFLKMNACGEKHGDQYFFLAHYGIFVVVQSILMTVFFWPGEYWDGGAFLSGALYSVFFIGGNFVRQYLQGDFKKLNASNIMMEPYARIFIQQFFIIVCGIFTLGRPEKNETLIITLFVFFKLIFELLWMVKRPTLDGSKK